MGRAARAVMYAGTVLAVVGLSKLHAFRHGYDWTGSSRFAWSLAYIGLLCVAAYGTGLPDLVRTRKAGLWAAVSSTVVAACAMSVAQLLAGSAQLPRLVVFGAPLVLVPLYLACATFASGSRARREGRDRVVLIAALDEAETLREELGRSPERSATLVSVIGVDDARPTGPRARPVVEAVVDDRASVLVLDRQAQADESIVSQAAALHESGVRVRTLSLFYDEWLGKLPVSELERVSLMFDIGEVHRARYGRVKRIVDVVLALGGLAVLVTSMPLIAFGNLLANRGPLIYSQPRVGRDGRVFSILKFRTMSADGPKVDWTEAGDPRVTRFGAWLRRTHVDELPQMVNVLRGDLSVVGPRPEQPQYVKQLLTKVPFYDFRHRVRPGLTGWAQVKYDYGSSTSDALEKLQYEFFYLRHQSLSLDARIMGRTVRSVVRLGGR